MKPLILILTAFHLRPEISQAYWLGIDRLHKEFDICVAAIVSDEENILLAKKNADVTIQAENKPLGKKMNAGLREVIEQPFDYLMQLGSDDLLTNAGMRKVHEEIEKKNPFFGFNHTLLFDSATKKTRPYKYGNVFGAGRCISKEVLTKAVCRKQVQFLTSVSGHWNNYGAGAIAYLPESTAEAWERGEAVKILGEREIHLWDDELNITLDMHSERKIEEVGYVAQPIVCDEPEIIAVKSKENLWKWDQFEGAEFSSGKLIDKISAKEYQYLMSL